MASTLRLSLVQTDIFWREPQKNLLQLEEKIKLLKGHTDLIVLPEVFTSGFTTEADWDLCEQGESSDPLAWLKKQAACIGAAIVGSVISYSEEGMRNRCYFVTEEGEVTVYDKVHLFRMADEHKRYRAGNERVVVEYKQWRILLTVCYDLRFPVFCRNRQDYDLMVCVANWPASRSHAWKTLLQARAIENQAYVVGVNRVGVDGNSLEYSGDSMVVDYIGRSILEFNVGQDAVKTAEIQVSELEQSRQAFPVWRDSDDFDMTIKQDD